MKNVQKHLDIYYGFSSATPSNSNNFDLFSDICKYQHSDLVTHTNKLSLVDQLICTTFPCLPTISARNLFEKKTSINREKNPIFLFFEKIITHQKFTRKIKIISWKSSVRDIRQAAVRRKLRKIALYIFLAVLPLELFLSDRQRTLDYKSCNHH